MRHLKINVLGKAWVLRDKIKTDLLKSNTLMDFNGDHAKVQNTKSQLDAAFGVKFEL
jgi:hypothetical protein